MLQTTSTERRAAGGDRPRSGGSVVRPDQQSNGQSGGKGSAGVKAGSQAEAHDIARCLGTLTNNKT